VSRTKTAWSVDELDTLDQITCEAGQRQARGRPEAGQRQARGCRGTARLMTALAVAAGIGCVLVTDDDGFCCCTYRCRRDQYRSINFGVRYSTYCIRLIDGAVLVMGANDDSRELTVYEVPNGNI
jgi:hypothetical protein